MAMTLLWNLFEWAGTLSFAVSGAIVGMRKQMDLFGIAVLAIVTAVGGGVLRDLMAKRVPAVFVTDVYATASLAGAVALCVVWRAGYAPAAPWVAVGVIAVLRCLAIRYRWQLFRPTGRRERGDR